MKFAYDGTVFEGYARQPGMRTVEGEIIWAVERAGLGSDSDIKIQSASRTDKGVSAAGNVVVIETEHDPRGIVPGLNANLDGIFVRGVARVGEDFNPRHASMRQYRYFLLDDSERNPDALLELANIFLGEHDFRLFSKTDTGGENTVLAIENISIRKENGFIIFDFEARRFLWQMIRRLVTAILAMYDRKLDASVVTEVLSGRGVRPILSPAPPEGLILIDVDYGQDIEFSWGCSTPDLGIAGALTRAAVLGQLEKAIGGGQRNKN